VAEGLITWMRYAGIDFAAVDADSQHLTLIMIIGGRMDQGLTRSRVREEERSELCSRQVGLDKDDGRGV
jgi:hypothetical protein